MKTPLPAIHDFYGLLRISDLRQFQFNCSYARSKGEIS